MATATFFGPKAGRFGEQPFEPRVEHARAKPQSAKPNTEAHTCPYCDQPILDERSSLLSLFRGGGHRLQVAIWMLAGAIVRCVRFGIATVLSLIGLMGIGCRALGLRIVHPHDRKLLCRTDERG